MNRRNCINYWMNIYMSKQANATAPLTPVDFNNFNAGGVSNMTNGVNIDNGMGGADFPGWGPRPKGVFPAAKWVGRGIWNSVKANPIMGIFGATSLFSWPSAIANSYNAMAHPALNTGNYWNQDLM